MVIRISFGSAGTGPAWFKAWTKSGQVMEFENSTDSRILATGKPEARSWAVNTVADTKGNFYTVSYVSDAANGQFYPSRIDYTGNAGAGLAPYNSVRFVYDTARPDVLTTYQAGSLMRTTVLLTNIQTYAGRTLVSDYRLAYGAGAATGRMRLRTVTLCDGAGACLPATTIGWTNAGDLTQGFPKTTIPASDTIPQFFRVFASGDFNQDGLTDLFVNHSYGDGRAAGLPDYNLGGQLWLSKGDGTFNKISVPATEAIPDRFQVYGSGDFNGDGLPDLYFNYDRGDGRAAGLPSYPQGGRLWLSIGDGTFNKLSVPATESAPHDRVFSIGDFNGDGLTDLYLNYSWEDGRAAGESSANLGGQLWLSKGDGTFNKLIVPATLAMPDYYQVFGAGDFNGDGLTDSYLQLSQADGRAYGPPSSQADLGYVWTSPGPPPDILASVTDGLGAQTKITYRPMTDGSVYTKDSGAKAASYPVVDIHGPMQVTSRLEQSDGLGGVRVSTYRYAGAKADLTGRGFLGFREMRARDEQTGIEQTSVYEQYYPFMLMKKSDERSLNGVVLSRQTNSYSSVSLGGTRYRVFLNQSVATGADLDGTPLPSATTSYQYDAFNNATQITVTASDGHSKTTTNTYTNDTAKWFLGRLTRASVKSTAP